jgi:hypothetical protein
MRRPRLHLRTVLVIVAFAAVILAVLAPKFRSHPSLPPGTWFGDGPFFTLYMPDGSVVVTTWNKSQQAIAEYMAQAKRYPGVPPMPAGFPLPKANVSAGAIAAQTHAPGRTP